eukprot:scaffold876_cov243-Pinguiococcus_pyrenoidosus.AAC.11
MGGNQRGDTVRKCFRSPPRAARLALRAGAERTPGRCSASTRTRMRYSSAVVGAEPLGSGISG